MPRALFALTALLLVNCSDPPPKFEYEPPSLELPAIEGDHVWAVDYGASKLEFTASEKGVPFEGRFDRFAVNIDLNLQAPENGTIEAVIDMGSVQAGNKDRDSTLMTPEWFFAEKFPTARFQAEQISMTGPGEYEAMGQLTVKDAIMDIVLPFTLTQDGDTAFASATYALRRLDWKMGTGSFASEKYVDYPVTLTIEVKARR